MTASGSSNRPYTPIRPGTWTPRRILLLLRRRALTVLTVVVAVNAVAILVLSSATPSYLAQALVAVEPRVALAGNVQPNAIVLPGALGLVENEVELAKAPTVLRRVALDTNLVNDPEFGSSNTSSEAALSETVSALSRAVNVSRVGISYLLAVDVRSEDPEKAALLANAVVEAYISEQSRREVAIEVLPSPRARIVSMAFPPDDPTSPNTALTLAGSLLLSIGLGVGLAIAREQRGALRDDREIEASFGVPVLATTPQLDGRQLTRQLDEVTERPESAFSEAIRRVRFHLSGSRGDVVLITSASPGEGKTLIATAIARSAAQAGRRVLLVDGSLHRPTLRESFGNAGMQTTLPVPSDKLDTEQLIRTSITDGTTGLRVVCPIEQTGGNRDFLLESEFFDRLISSAKSTFDMVIVDGPALLPVPDAQVFLRSASKAIVVVRWNATRRPHLIAALDELARFKDDEAEVAVVMNGRGVAPPW